MTLAYQCSVKQLVLCTESQSSGNGHGGGQCFIWGVFNLFPQLTFQIRVDWVLIGKVLGRIEWENRSHDTIFQPSSLQTSDVFLPGLRPPSSLPSWWRMISSSHQRSRSHLQPPSQVPYLFSDTIFLASFSLTSFLITYFRSCCSIFPILKKCEVSLPVWV